MCTRVHTLFPRPAFSIDITAQLTKPRAASLPPPLTSPSLSKTPETQFLKVCLPNSYSSVGERNTLSVSPLLVIVKTNCFDLTRSNYMGKVGKKCKQKATAKSGLHFKHLSQVTEQAKNKITRWLKDFAGSKEPVYIFEANLSKEERAMVHVLCRKMGMTSKSTGKGFHRHVSVYKFNKTPNKKAPKKKTPSSTFSEESKRVLMDLFMHYPPGKDHIGEENLSKQTGNNPKLQGRDDVFMRPLMSKANIAKKVNSLACKINSSSRLKEISMKRSQLPIASYQTDIALTVANNQVVLICGETGCGKTTQVPQYLLDYKWEKGEACKIVCTQPRRISAISVSERIAQERGEKIGDSVGYKIRLETRGGRGSSILFCTSGILLRVLVSSRESPSDVSIMKAKKYISEITHIVVDEIHERDQYSDFMLTILRDLLPAHPHLRLVLMSATIDAERFSQYFGGCPVIHVPGFTHPVKSFYLEEVLSIVKTPERNHLNDNALATGPLEEVKLGKECQVAMDEAIEMSCSTEEFDSLLELISSERIPNVLNYQHYSTGVTPLMVFAGNGRLGDVCTLLSLGADCQLQANDGSTALDWAKHGNHTEAAAIIKRHMEASPSGSLKEGQLLQNYMVKVNPELIDYVLIEQLLRKVCSESEDGAVLVFLPGWEEINRTQKTLLANSFFKNSSYLVLPLHSMVPPAEQKKVFQRPPKGCRKIILSTNIAETSVTIDDVVYVIDTGRVKEKGYDPYSNVSTLKSSWISKASAKQREGRAGRCQPGVCYHLYSKLKAVSLADFQEPEIKRMPIEELCLQVKMLDPNCNLEVFLKKTLDPPILETVNNAIAVLQDIGALSSDEQLTEMGAKLGCLPVHPLTSRMLFSSILLNCLDPALTLACVAEYRDPFILPMLPKDKAKVDVARAKLAALYGGRSDQLAIIAAFDCWMAARSRGLESKFCSEYFVSPNIMRMLHGMRMQLLKELRRGRFLSHDDVSVYNVNARNPGIILSVLVAGSYPGVGIICRSHKFGKAFFVETSSGSKAQLLSRSLVSKLSVNELFDKNNQGLLLAYDEVTQGDGGLQIRKCTPIGQLPLLLFAKEIAVVSEDDIGKLKTKKGKLKKANPVGQDTLVDGDGKDSYEGESENPENLSAPDEIIMASPDDAVTVLVDGWLKFTLTALEVAHIYCLRERLSAAILFKISYPRDCLPPSLHASMHAVACLMAFDGMSAISLPALDRTVDLLTSLENITEDTLKKRNTTEPRYNLRSVSPEEPSCNLRPRVWPLSKKRKSAHAQEIFPTPETKPMLEPPSPSKKNVVLEESVHAQAIFPTPETKPMLEPLSPSKNAVLEESVHAQAIFPTPETKPIREPLSPSKKNVVLEESVHAQAIFPTIETKPMLEPPSPSKKRQRKSKSKKIVVLEESVQAQAIFSTPETEPMLEPPSLSKNVALEQSVHPPTIFPTVGTKPMLEPPSPSKKNVVLEESVHAQAIFPTPETKPILEPSSPSKKNVVLEESVHAQVIFPTPETEPMLELPSPSKKRKRKSKSEKNVVLEESTQAQAIFPTPETKPILEPDQQSTPSKKRKRKSKSKKNVVLEESAHAQGIFPTPKTKPMLEPPSVQIKPSKKRRRKSNPIMNESHPAGVSSHIMNEIQPSAGVSSLPVVSTALEMPMLGPVVPDPATALLALLTLANVSATYMPRGA